MNFLITGASGFIGFHLTNLLSDCGHTVIAIVRSKSKALKYFKNLKNIQIIEASMENYHKLPLLINNVCDVFFSLAWNGIRGTERNDKDIQISSYYNSLNAIKSAIALGCKNIVITGSQAEYGEQPNEIITEETLCNPITQYGIHKLKLFHHSLILCKTQKAVLKEARIFSLYGDGDYENSLIMYVLKKMIRNQDCQLTACTHPWDFLHVDDAVKALMLLGLVDSCEGAYNVAYGNSYPLKFFIEKMYKITGSQSRLLYGNILYSPFNSIGIKASIDKISKQIGFFPTVTFEDGISRLISQGV